MEAREPLDADVADLDAAARRRSAPSVERIRPALGAAEAEIIDEMRERASGARRDRGRASTPRWSTTTSAVARHAQGVGVARLVGTTCQGCHLSIPAIEAEQIKSAGGRPLAHCDNCGAILVP